MANFSFSATLKGSDTLRTIYRSVGSGIFMGAVGRAVGTEAQKMMREAKRQVPLDQGPLRASGTVEPVMITGTSWSCRLGFGGAASAYALYQHENMGFSHAPGRKAHYLSDPVKTMLPGMEQDLRRIIGNYFTPSVGGAASSAIGAQVASSNAAAAEANGA